MPDFFLQADVSMRQCVNTEAKPDFSVLQDREVTQRSGDVSTTFTDLASLSLFEDLPADRAQLVYQATTSIDACVAALAGRPPKPLKRKHM